VLYPFLGRNVSQTKIQYIVIFQSSYLFFYPIVIQRNIFEFQSKTLFEGMTFEFQSDIIRTNDLTRPPGCQWHRKWYFSFFKRSTFHISEFHLPLLIQIDWNFVKLHRQLTINCFLTALLYCSDLNCRLGHNTNVWTEEEKSEKASNARHPAARRRLLERGHRQSTNEPK
jgi:hypothetical protein